MIRPGLLGKLDARNDRILEICEEEGASLAQYHQWMTTAMAEEIRNSTFIEFRDSYAWLNRHGKET